MPEDSKVYAIEESSSSRTGGTCLTIKEARDKPIEIKFHPNTPTVLIINQATGDVFVQNFAGMGKFANTKPYNISLVDEALLKNSGNKLKLNEFLEVEGEKRAFVFDSSFMDSSVYPTAAINEYLTELSNRGVNKGIRITVK